MNERVTTAGIVEKDGKYLLGCRNTEGSVNNEKWEFIGGKNRWGESEVDTLKREFMEELGVPVSVGELIAQVDFTNKDTLYHLKAYHVYPESDDFTLSVHSSLSYFTLSEMEGLDMVDSDKEIVRILDKSV